MWVSVRVSVFDLVWGAVLGLGRKERDGVHYLWSFSRFCGVCVCVCVCLTVK